jgi:outer membrane receptor protein involved in Fe transport
MRRAWEVLTGAGIVFGAFAGPAGAQVPQRGTGIIVGTIVDASTKRPVVGAQAYVVSNPRIGGQTTESGAFVLKSVPSGEQVVKVRFLGFKSDSAHVTVGSDTVRVSFELQETANMLEQVVVTGTTGEVASKEVPVAVSVVTPTEIERKGANSLQDVLRGSVPGVYVVAEGSFDYFTYLFGRGSTSLNGYSSMKVYVDGVAMANSEYLQALNPADIDRVEVIRGPQASTLYGSQAQNGVIQIFTKKGALNVAPVFDISTYWGAIHGPYTNGVYYNADGSKVSGLNGLQDKTQINVTGGNEGLSYTAGASYEHRGPWVSAYAASIPTYYGSGKATFGALDAAISYRSGDQLVGYTQNPGVRRQTLSGQLGPPNSYVGTSLGLLGLYGLAPAYADGSYPITDFHVAGTGASVNFDYHLAPNWVHTIIVGRDQTEERYKETPFGGQNFGYSCTCDTNYYALRYSQLSTSLRYQTSYTMQFGRDVKSALQGGFETSAFDVEESYGYSSSWTGPFNTSPGIISQESWDRGQYVQDETTFWDRLTATVGAREEDAQGFGSGTTFWNKFAPRGGLAYSSALAGDLSVKLRGSYGVTFNAPTLAQKAPGSSGPTYMYLSNFALRPERNQGFDGGIDLFFGTRGSASVTYYNQMAKDLIGVAYLATGGISHVATPSDPSIYQYQNLGALKNIGWETEARYTVGRLTATGNFTYSWSTPTNLYPGYAGAAKIGHQLYYQPHFLGGGQVSYVTRNLTLGWETQFQGPKEGIWYDEEYRYLYGRWAPTTTGANAYMYTVMNPTTATYNVSANYTIQRFPGWSAFGRVNNIADNMTPAGDDNYPQPGRSFYLGVRHVNVR